VTYSIVARDEKTGFLGVAVASRFFAVGGVVPHVRGRLGAIATQGFVNPRYGTEGLLLLARGEEPKAIAERLTSEDEGSPQRQLHLIDARGRNAAFTGARCIDWAGHEVADNVSVAGNMLSGPEVVSATLRTYQTALDKPLTERLLLAMQAGEDAGGDQRGRQSASLIVYRDQDYAWLDIRADDHADPLAELRRLYAVAQERYLHVCETMPTRDNPHGMIDRTEIDLKIAALEEERRRSGVTTSSFMTPR
jgi:uncharacterized Ntn-hydrolase superfamily protein